IIGSVGASCSAVGSRANKSLMPNNTQPYIKIPIKNKFLATSMYFTLSNFSSFFFNASEITGLYSANTPAAGIIKALARFTPMLKSPLASLEIKCGIITESIRNAKNERRLGQNAESSQNQSEKKKMSLNSHKMHKDCIDSNFLWIFLQINHCNLMYKQV